MNESIISTDDSLIKRIGESILVLRGERVILSPDIAEFYGVTTKVLNQAVKRNIERFPNDFMFQISKEETEEVVTKCDHLSEKLKFVPTQPYAFTEEGVAMLSGVLRSPRAVQVNIMIMRAFVQLRRWAVTYDELAQRLEEIEVKCDVQFDTVFNLLDEIMSPPELSDRPIGFRSE